MRPRPLAWLCLLGLSCLPDFHSLEGRACDAEHGCVYAELTCQHGACTAQPGPGQLNLLQNPGFEGGLSSWTASAGARLSTTASPVHSGASAAAVWAPATGASGDQPGLTQDLAAPFEQGTLVCWDGWVDTGTLASPVELTIRYRSDDDAGTHFTLWSARAAPDGGRWQQAARSVAVAAAHNTLTGFLVRADFQADASWAVDDLRLWFGADGGCADGP